tara:strand:- start:30 stop:281 length:252 start_codon:yes stop_codon:yes gene_type:complete
VEQVKKKIKLNEINPNMLILFVLRAYQILISPLLGPRCRFFPTCSNYAIEAIKKYGFWRGGFLTFKRVVKCRPGCACGVDEVP